MPSADGAPIFRGPRSLASALDLGCRRGGRWVLAGLSFELHAGSVLELRGANGSGKTTLLRLLAGLVPLASGILTWSGRQHNPADTLHARRIAYLGHLNGLSADLSVAENLHFARQLDGTAPHDGLAEPQALALETWGLAAQAKQAVHRLSQGQRRRLALARIWMSGRPLWLLDEPCAALDAAGERLFDERLVAHLQAGGSAVVATHRSLDVPAPLLQRLDLGALPKSRAVHASEPEDAAAAC